MGPVSGGYFDGTVTTRHEVRLTIEPGVLCIRGNGIELCHPLDSVRLSAAVGSVHRSIRLPDGGLCEVSDQGFLREMELAQGSGKRAALLHRWEKSLPLALAALGLTVLLVALFIRFGVPALARQAAFALPPAAESAMGRESLAVLDRLLTIPSKLSARRRAELTALFQRVATTSGSSPGCRIEFRASPAIGANALALPSGIVVITDELVELARNDGEIAAIISHELGHVRQRHALRHALQNSVAGLVMATLTGDLVSITSLAATLPTALVNASFSREFEREADDAAISWLKSAGVPPSSYAAILGRLQAQLDIRSGPPPEGRRAIRNYLSSHPDTGQRIRRIMNAGR